MNPKNLLVSALCAICLSSITTPSVRAQNTVITYQGRVSAHGTNFTGLGQFKFALVTSTNNNHTAAAAANLSGAFLTSYTVTSGGNGYTSPPAVTITGGGGSGATATAIVSGGVVIGISAGLAGSGYTSVPTVTIAPPPPAILYSTYWSNDGSVSGESEPATSVGVQVVDGLFTARLGDTALANMTALPAALFVQPDLELRLWFNDGVSGFAALDRVQPLTAAPYARYAAQFGGMVSNASLAGTYGNALTFSNAANSFAGSFTGDGGGLTGLNAAQLATGTVPDAALGNAWKLGGNSGTTPGAQFLGTTDNQPLEFKVNGLTALRMEPTANLRANLIGGVGNTVATGAHTATIAGGFHNDIAANASFSTIGGGEDNHIAGDSWAATIAGGAGNNIRLNSDYSTIGGGSLNNIPADSFYATIPGGYSNSAVSYAFAAGRRAKANHTGSFVWADSQDTDFASTIINQFNIRANGGVRLNNDTSLNFGNQTRQMLNLWNFSYGIGVQSDATYFRSGNDFHWYRGGIHSDTNGSAGGGGAALMSLTRSGNLGLGTTAPFHTLDAQGSQAVGRFTTTSSVNGAVLILKNATASPTYLGAINFETGNDTPGQIGYLASGDMAFRVGGEERMRLNSGGLTVNGTFVSASDRNVKEDFAAVDAQEVLNKVAALPLQSWSYTNRPGVKHVGPMAQDFRAAFGLGEDDKHIATVDADGVALAAIQGLNRKLTEELQRRDAENAELKRRLERLEARMSGQTTSGSN